ncbi:hypothetical protein L596_003149 [Steinernema carpocapsae]|uniref:Phosphodiesterase n=1 Tax=Steinernema carpocapsae TaxID=34508 RepID=A0A4U8USB7_STECR|nr:hypothetical protein L596_003149 [Steinernema carpocapsae]
MGKKCVSGSTSGSKSKSSNASKNVDRHDTLFYASLLKGRVARVFKLDGASRPGTGARCLYACLESNSRQEASKPRVSNITFSTVTSATGLPTIAAEPSRPRSSSYWKPSPSERSEISGTTLPINVSLPSKLNAVGNISADTTREGDEISADNSQAGNGPAGPSADECASSAPSSSNTRFSGNERSKKRGSGSDSSSRSGVPNTGRQYGSKHTVDTVTFEVNEDTASEASSSGECENVIHVNNGDSFDRCEMDSDPMLGGVAEWSLPIFQLAERYKHSVLSRLTYTIFTKSDLFRIFKLSYAKFFNFFHALEQGYWDIPYHNRIHAADVLHAVYYLTCHPVAAFAPRPSSPSEPGVSRPPPRVPIAENMSNLELLALFTAAAMHDYDHPGRTNAFLVASEDKKAIMYNDRSVLENHHAAESWRLLCQPENCFIETLDPAETKRFRYLVLEYILATDLKQHFDLIMQFTEKTSDMDLTSESDRVLVSQMLIKFADINSPAKPYSLHQQWTERICAEFYEQGDEEKRRKMAISPYMDRDDPAVAKLQDSFIAHIVNPLAVALQEAGLLPVLPGLSESELIINLKHNHQKWLVQIDSQNPTESDDQAGEPRINGSMSMRTMSETVIEEESDSLLGSASTSSDKKCDSDVDTRFLDMELNDPPSEKLDARSPLE